MTQTPSVHVAMEQAAKIFDENLGDLPALLAKVSRGGIRTGPSAPMVAAWVEANPRAAALIVGAVAMVQAARINEDRQRWSPQ